MTLSSLFRSRNWHIYTLWALGVAYPLLDQLANNPEYFVAKGSQATDIIVLPLLLFYLLPSLLVIVIFGITRVRSSLGNLVFAIVFCVLLFSVVQIAVNRSITGFSPALIATGISFTILISYGYWKFDSIRLFLGYLTPAIVIFPIVFFSHHSVQKFFVAEKTIHIKQNVEARFPIVMVTFDEFPLAALLDGQSQIDAENFPNFAKLAAGSNWYRNATTVADSTGRAVSAMLTGQYPDGEMPAFTDYPKNLFTLLGNSYQMNVMETATGLCPKAICNQARMNLWQRINLNLKDLSAVYGYLILPEDIASRFFPPVTQGWEDFWGFGDDRAQQFKNFLQSINPSQRVPFYFLHSSLPHQMYQYLPSGAPQDPHLLPALRRQIESQCKGDPAFLTSLQQLLFQVGFVDKLLGALIDRLKQVDLYDRSLLIITADHGICLRPGEPPRAVTRTNYNDILLVPLFIKLPGQKTGVAADKNVQLIDLVPTIAQLLGTKIEWADGVSIFDSSRAERDRKFLDIGPGRRDAYPPHITPNAVTLRAREELKKARITPGKVSVPQP